MLRGFSRKVRAATDETDIRLGSLIAQDPIGAGPAPSRTFNIRQPQPIRFNTMRGSGPGIGRLAQPGRRPPRTYRHFVQVDRR
jgi:hypothetical protein